MNKFDARILNEIKEKTLGLRKNQREDTISAWLKHQKVRV